MHTMVFQYINKFVLKNIFVLDINVIVNAVFSLDTLQHKTNRNTQQIVF